MSPDETAAYLMAAAEERDRKRFDIDVRRFALGEAVNLMKGGVSVGVVQSSAVLLCAEQFRRYLQDGEMPDLSDAIKSTHEYAWHIVRGLYPESEIQRAVDGVK